MIDCKFTSSDTSTEKSFSLVFLFQCMYVGKLDSNALKNAPSKQVNSCNSCIQYIIRETHWLLIWNACGHSLVTSTLKKGCTRQVVSIETQQPTSHDQNTLPCCWWHCKMYRVHTRTNSIDTNVWGLVYSHIRIHNCYKKYLLTQIYSIWKSSWKVKSLHITPINVRHTSSKSVRAENIWICQKWRGTQRHI